MSIDDQLRDLFDKEIPPADTPLDLADELIARATASGGTNTSGAGFNLPLIIGLAVAGGLIVGGVLALLGGGGSPTASSTISLDAVPVFACPGEGEVGTLYRGDRVLITGRSGEWVAVRNVRGENERVFVRSTYVSPDTDISGLPEENCNEVGSLSLADAPGTTTTTTVPGAAATTTTVPPTSTTTTAPETTTVPPTSTTTTTQPPDTTSPAIANENVTPGQIWEEDGVVSGFTLSCDAKTPRQATISAFVTDNVGVTSVTATWSDPLGDQSVAMSGSGSTYTATIGPYPAGTWDPLSNSPYDHPVTITITARDAAGNTATTSISMTVTEIASCAFG